MKPIISIEYCTAWDYRKRAVALTESVLKLFKNEITSLNIIPSDDGKFHIKFNDEIIYSKEQLNRFPEQLEIEKIIREKI